MSRIEECVSVSDKANFGKGRLEVMYDLYGDVFKCESLSSQQCLFVSGSVNAGSITSSGEMNISSNLNVDGEVDLVDAAFVATNCQIRGNALVDNATISGQCVCATASVPQLLRVSNAFSEDSQIIVKGSMSSKQLTSRELSVDKFVSIAELRTQPLSLEFPIMAGEEECNVKCTECVGSWLAFCLTLTMLPKGHGSRTLGPLSLSVPGELQRYEAIGAPCLLKKDTKSDNAISSWNFLRVSANKIHIALSVVNPVCSESVLKIGFCIRWIK